MTKLRALAIVLIATLTLLGVRALRGRSERELLGLWQVGSPEKFGDPMRFYYFHTGGKGLYRYGQVGLNQTRSFDWSISGDEIMLRFRKSGETARTRFVIEQRDGQKELVLRSDPRNEGTQRYRFRPASLGDVEVEGPLAVSPSDASADGSGLERIWIDLQKFATGGQAFSMYQLSKHTVAGSKLGWFHAGDFDDWSTEAFVYRLEPGALSMTFLVRGDRGTTPFRVAEDPRARNNVLTLESDPRDFHARHRYANAGPSF